MNAIEKLLEEAKSNAGINSDNALAIEIGVKRQTISKYRKGISTPDIFTMSRLADLTGRPIEQVIALVEIEKEQPEEKRKYWQNFYERLGGVAATIFISMNIGFVTFKVSPTPLNAFKDGLIAVTQCILCKIIMTITYLKEQFNLPFLKSKTLFRQHVARV